ncbi:MAG: hypothetical protein GY731_09050, partial [Gammaproteobacteria bacterium]|nr:hypothetical protein [Gammaproteobacteria bacterium]
RQVVVFVEEAQSMPLETLEEIRLLSNLETQRAKLLQIVLFGQPELEPNLSEPHIRQLRERITHSFDLPPFSKPETKEYLDFRMRAAGYRGPEVFSPSAVRAITNASMGLIRRTNILADKSLLAAYAAGVHRITGSQVKVALKDSEFGRSPPRQFSGRALAAGIFLPVLVGGGYLLGSGYWSGRVGGEAAPAPAVAIEAPVLAGEPIHPPPSPISTGERQMVGPVPPAPEGQTGVVLRPSEAIINVIEEGDAEPGQQSVTRNQPTVETWIASGGATGMATEQQINPPPGTVAGVAKQRIAAPAGEGITGDQEVDTAAVSPGMIASVAQETAVAPAPASHGKNKGAADVVVPKDVGSRAVREPLAEDGASSTMVAGAEIPVENRVNNTSPVAMDGLGAQPVRGVRQSGTLGGVAKKTEYGPRIGGGEQDFLEYRLMETRHWLQRADG